MRFKRIFALRKPNIKMLSVFFIMVLIFLFFVMKAFYPTKKNYTTKNIISVCLNKIQLTSKKYTH